MGLTIDSSLELELHFYRLPEQDVVDLHEALYEADWDLIAAKEIISTATLAGNTSDDGEPDNEEA